MSEPRDAGAATRDTGAPAFEDCKPSAYGGVFTGSVEVAGMMFSNVLGTVSATATLADGDQYLQLNDAKAFGVDETC